MTDPSPWPIRLRLGEIQRTSPTLELGADEPRRAAIAKALGLDALERFAAVAKVRPWLDGAEISARWNALVRQTCGVSLEPFDSELSGEFIVRAVPADSPAAAAVESEALIDPEAEDPPDVLESDEIDVGAYLVEYLGLEVDPFPRKPGVAFEPPPEERPASPFAVLKGLKTTSGSEE